MEPIEANFQFAAQHCPSLNHGSPWNKFSVSPTQPHPILELAPRFETEVQWLVAQWSPTWTGPDLAQPNLGSQLAQLNLGSQVAWTQQRSNFGPTNSGHSFFLPDSTQVQILAHLDMPLAFNPGKPKVKKGICPTWPKSKTWLNLKQVQF